MAVLVVGGSGFLGREVVRQSLTAGGRVSATYLTRPADLVDHRRRRLRPRTPGACPGGGRTDRRAVHRRRALSVHVADLAAALLELAASGHTGMHHVAGADAVSRHELGALIAHRDRLDPAALPAGRRADTDPPGPIDVRLDCTMTQQRLRTTLRGARQFVNHQTGAAGR